MTSTNVTSDAQRVPTIPQANGHTTGDHDLTSDNELDLRDQHKSRTSTEIEKEGFSDSDVIQPSCDDDVTDKCDGCDVKRTNGEGGAAEEEEEEEEERGGCCWGMRRRRKKREKTSVGLFGLFRYAGPVDVVMMAVGTLAAMVTGCIQPLSFVLCGEMINTFIANLKTDNDTSAGGTLESSLQEDTKPLILNYVMTGGVALVSGYLAMSLWTWAGQRQITRIRKLFFRSLLRQDMAWFDTHTVGQLNSRFSEEGNWDLYVATVEDSMPIFAEFNWTNYQRYGSWYLEQIKVLEFTHPELYRRFSMGLWVVKDRPGWFCAVGGDMKVEQTIQRVSKGPGARYRINIGKIHEGMADKVAIFVEWCSTWLACLTIAFVTGWKLALAVLAFSPAFICVGATVGKVLRGVSVKETEAYARSGAVAEEALKSIRTVQAFQGQEREHSKYHEKLKAGRDLGRRKGVVLGVGTGLFSLLIFSSFAASCYYGVTLIHTDGLLPGTVIMVSSCGHSWSVAVVCGQYLGPLLVFATTLLGSLVLGRAFPSLQAFSTARAAAGHVFDVINLRPHIDVTSTLGLTIAPLTGLIEFRDVHFRYPSRPDVPVLRGLSLLVHPGQTVAIVGASGCGKTTTVQLLLRFYDPQHGQISIDGHNVRDLNLRWLRDQMGVVSQEPVLFAATIADNIRYGQPDVTNDLIQAAAMEANAHDFISQLPQGYDTTVGERGAQLSGGQKQRIAIARALVRNPRILLLDEATSALDHKSEAVVQSALDKARQGRTTIVIAHRLSTIRHADVIVTLSGGRKMEEGSHEELMAQRSMYAQLVSLQV
ncbi:hypothetical protein ACOMHN_029928 [Nucella lapillus]